MKRLSITVHTVGVPALAYAEDVARLLLAGTQQQPQRDLLLTDHPADGRTLTASRYTKATRGLFETGGALKIAPTL